MNASYQIIYNRFHNEYQVWATKGLTSEIIKRFKSEESAKRWVAARKA